MIMMRKCNPYFSDDDQDTDEEQCDKEQQDVLLYDGDSNNVNMFCQHIASQRFSNK
jgi:hypothetical protein